MWDNRVTMHRARRYDPKEVRDMRRTTLTNGGVEFGAEAH
jgi:alpha-ketoglutarate-dependent 2,4-dichlorophenoxyacetate dioxygenase